MRENIKKNETLTYEGKEAEFRGMVKLIYWQLEGLWEGYKIWGRRLSIEDLYFLNADGQLSEYEEIFQN